MRSRGIPNSIATFCPIILYCFWLILLISFSLNLHFSKGSLFCVALVIFVLFLSGEEMSTLVAGMCSICFDMVLALAVMH